MRERETEMAEIHVRHASRPTQPYIYISNFNIYIFNIERGRIEPKILNVNTFNHLSYKCLARPVS